MLPTIVGLTDQVSFIYNICAYARPHPHTHTPLTDDYFRKVKLEGDNDKEISLLFPRQDGGRVVALSRLFAFNLMYFYNLQVFLFIVFLSPLEYKWCEDRDFVIYIEYCIPKVCIAWQVTDAQDTCLLNTKQITNTMN